MKSLRIACAFIQVPRLCVSLLLIPALLGVVLIAFQVFGTLVMIEVAQKPKNSDSEDSPHNKKDPASLVRMLLYGARTPLPPIEVCRWKIEEREKGPTEVPASTSCAPGRLDVAVRTESPDTFDVNPLARILNGNVARLHVCRSCHPDVIMEDSVGHFRTHATSVWGLVLVSLTQFNTAIEEHRVKMRESREEADSLVGDLFFYAWGVERPVAISECLPNIALIFNVASIVLLALWLALKAHRKVLLLFSRSGALLPLVAGLGHRTFYTALWWITGFRVSCFLAGAIPLSVVGLLSLDQSTTIPHRELLVWIVGLVCSFSFATIVASIADLKERHTVMHLAYLYIPLLVSAFGGIFWTATFLLDSSFMGYLRWALVSIPLVGMVPLILSPLLPAPLWCLAIHGGLSSVGILYVVRNNSSWFASHLEEV